MNKIDCEAARDSLSKALYDKLFNWLVKRLNLSILPPEDLKQTSSVRKSVKEVRRSTLVSGAVRLSVGLLDIFGFENFQVKITRKQKFFFNYFIMKKKPISYF